MSDDIKSKIKKIVADHLGIEEEKAKLLMYSKRNLLFLCWEGRGGGGEEERVSLGPGLSSRNASDLPPHPSVQDPVASSPPGGSPSLLPDDGTPPKMAWSSVGARGRDKATGP